MQQQPEPQQEGKVIFEPEAYLKALLHVLRFASDNREQDSWVEVYGWLVGRLAGNDLHILDVVPLQHGKDIEVVWDADTYVRAAEFNDKLFEEAEKNPEMKNVFIVGWYHSHPGLDLFLSSTDITNHLSFQGPNPKSVAIVFDHTKMVPYKHLGFKIFRLDETSPDSGYHEVAFDRSRFSKDIMTVIYGIVEMVDNIQGDKPFIMEYGEAPSVFTQLMLPSAVPPIDHEPPINLNAFFEKILDSTKQFTKKLLGDSILGKMVNDLNPAMEEWFSAFIPYLTTSLNRWLIDLAEKVVITNKLTLGSVYTVASTLKHSMKDITDWIKEHTTKIKKDLRSQLDEHEGKLQDLVESSTLSMQEHLSETSSLQENMISSKLDNFADLVNHIKAQVANNEVIINKLVQENKGLRATLIEERRSSDAKISTLQQALQDLHQELENMPRILDTKYQDKINSLGNNMQERIHESAKNVNENTRNEIAPLKASMDALKTTMESYFQVIDKSNASIKRRIDELEIKPTPGGEEPGKERTQEPGV
ncbi:hypothetical protein GF325_11930 [Candidatus Bathyarchaeota archaeon]|nr:hypothetical protein [Candidatus Bathyarchaeota archaeon]